MMRVCGQPAISTFYSALFESDEIPNGDEPSLIWTVNLWTWRVAFSSDESPTYWIKEDIPPTTHPHVFSSKYFFARCAEPFNRQEKAFTLISQ
jgi:hypothetical protein